MFKKQSDGLISEQGVGYLFQLPLWTPQVSLMLDQILEFLKQVGHGSFLKALRLLFWTVFETAGK